MKHCAVCRYRADLKGLKKERVTVNYFSSTNLSLSYLFVTHPQSDSST